MTSYSRKRVNIKPQIVVNNNLGIDVSGPILAPYPAVATRKDQLTEAVRLEIKRLMVHHGHMQQKELATRANEKQQRVHKFIKGQMPYPPMDFLDRLFRVFGVTLVDGLKGPIKPVTQLPILRPDVQTLADTCSGMAPAAVEAVQNLASLLRAASPPDVAPAPGQPARSGNKRRTNGKRNTPKG